MNKFISKLIATGFYSGFAPIAPGTFGSLVAFPIFYLPAIGFLTLISQSIADQSFPGNILVKFFVMSLCLTMVIYYIGHKATANYLKTTDKTDPNEVVIDEIAGQLVTLTLVIPMFALTDNWPVIFGSAFLLFRAYDILKPWPINRLEKLPGASGVMLDDIAAGIYAGIMSYVVFFIVGY